MARARNIKPGFFKNDVLGELPPLARLLFAGLWTHCDRAGRCEDRPKRIKAEILAYDDCDCDTLLQALHDSGFIERYEVGGVRVIRVVEWDKHQNPHVKESPSELPAPEEHGASTVQVRCEEQPEPERAGLIPSSLIPSSLSPSVQEGADALSQDQPKAKAKKFDAKDVELPEWLDPVLWGQWVDDRKQRGKPITEAGAQKQFARLAEYRESGHSPKDVLDHAMASGNQGLYPPPRIDNKGQAPPRTFREREADVAAARYAEMTGGRVSAKQRDPFDTIEMETGNAIAFGLD